ncbi:MAG TPA: ATP-binding protein [Roseiarcus sp.]|nr:ATP-binding protein [Roseiarcus sp.]
MQARTLTIRLIWLAMGASLLVPLLLFSLASWISYRHIEDITVERLQRSLDIEEEEAQKDFLLVKHALDDASALVDQRSAIDILADQERLHEQLETLVANLGPARSIWIYDVLGNALVSSAVQPPPQENFSDLDFIRAHEAGEPGVYYGRVYPSPVNSSPYFSVSRGVRRKGSLEYVVVVWTPPSSFFRFYAAMAYASGLQYGLIRNDGYILARYPVAPPNAPDRLNEDTGFRRTIAERPEGGLFSTKSAIDGITRRFAARQLDGAPLYVQAGIATSAIRDEWIGQMAPHLIFGIPATLLLFLTLFAVLRRTERLYAEMDQRAIAEESLRQAQKMEAIGQLTGGVAHDFNNILTIILGNLEMAKRQLTEGKEGERSKLAQRVESAIQGAVRAATLVKRLLAFSRQQTLDPTVLDINRLLCGLADFLQRAIGETISLEVVGAAGLWQVEADQTELEAAILNLAINARDAMPEGGKLTIEAANAYLDDAYCRQYSDLRPGQYVLISVSDTGTGMPKEVVERAFEPFFTTKQAGQGTGLGLSQVYGFVKQSGGHVKIYSEVGEGTTIRIYLRRFVAGPAPALETAPEVGRGRGAETVLVAEDDGEVRAYVVETLERLGYQVLGASGADEALEVMHNSDRVDLLLTDVVMPGASGRKLAEEAKRLQPDLKVLFMTGYSRNAIVHQGRLDPGVDLIQKPLTGDALAATVRKLLDG